jgi:pimeloyl-ACP methyl ester carboxylesterase
LADARGAFRYRRGDCDDGLLTSDGCDLYCQQVGEARRSSAAAILDSLRTPPTVVVGTSAGAAIAVDLAVRRPDLVQVVIAHECPWRFARHVPTVSQIVTFARIG